MFPLKLSYPPAETQSFVGFKGLCLLFMIIFKVFKFAWKHQNLQFWQSPSLAQLTHPHLTNAIYILRSRTSFTWLPLFFLKEVLFQDDSWRARDCWRHSLHFATQRVFHTSFPAQQISTFLLFLQKELLLKVQSSSSRGCGRLLAVVVTFHDVGRR